MTDQPNRDRDSSRDRTLIPCAKCSRGYPLNLMWPAGGTYYCSPGCYTQSMTQRTFTLAEIAERLNQVTRHRLEVDDNPRGRGSGLFEHEMGVWLDGEYIAQALGIDFNEFADKPFTVPTQTQPQQPAEGERDA